ncbi:MAG: hypothetical protein KAG66_22045, partial [Methylococcales bacterium]|nr:hypothetical protein [Methylococcales bacterium]
MTQVLFAGAHRLAGLDGIAWLTALVLATTYAVLTAGIERLGVRAPIALVAGFLASVVGALHTLTRPHIFTLLILTIFLVIIEQYRKDNRWQLLLWLPPLMVLWANLHGAFITGFVLMGMYMVGAVFDRRWRQLGVFIVLSGVLFGAGLLNPEGMDLVEHSFGYLEKDFLVNTTMEYQSPDFHAVSTWPFAGILLITIALGWRSRDRMDWTSLLLLGAWSAFSLYSARNIPLFAQAALIVLARYGDTWLEEEMPAFFNDILQNVDKIARRSSGWIWAVGVVVLLVGLQIGGVKLDVLKRGNIYDKAKFPVEAITQLSETMPEGPVFNEFIWGGYLLYRLYPAEQIVFIDAQTDYYGEALTLEYLHV